MKYLWWCLSDEETAEDARTVVTRDYEDASDAAEMAADIDDSNGAYEASWPRRYAVQPETGDNRKVQVFEVDREYSPTYTARAVRKCKTDNCKRLAEDAGRCRQCYKAYVIEYCASADAMGSGGK